MWLGFCTHIISCFVNTSIPAHRSSLITSASFTPLYMLSDTYQWKITPTCLGLDLFYMLCFPHFLVVIQYPLRFFPLEHRVVIKSHWMRVLYHMYHFRSERFLNLSVLRFLCPHFSFWFRDSEFASLVYQYFPLLMPLLSLCSCYSSILFLQVSQEKTLCLPKSDIIALPYIAAVSPVAPGHSSWSQLWSITKHTSMSYLKLCALNSIPIQVHRIPIWSLPT